MSTKKIQTIKAVRGSEKREFATEAWNALPASKYGWKKATEVPEEVAETVKEETGKPATAPEEKAMNVKELSALINEAKTVEDVDKLVPEGEDRVTVLNAAKARKEQLKNDK